ncbi:MAG TPA: F0F1 ATP synthase subunit delta [Xanthomonadaceae bacterium]|nr:F0F1 ATP synthase subunit delta [Xanthomonadaceae bacterium]
MSNAMTLARPYARAAFAVARQGGRLPAWSALLGFSAMAASQPQAMRLITHPKMSDAEVVALIAPPGEVDPNFREFLAVLARNQRMTLLPEIAAMFDALRAEEERVVKAMVTSAAPMDQGELESIRTALSRRFGREVELQTAVDPDLIGGAVIDTGEMVIDGSIRGKLRRMEGAIAH